MQKPQEARLVSPFQFNMQILNPPKLAGMSAALSLLITGILVAIHHPYWHYYAIGSLYGLIWIMSYHLKPKFLPFTLALSLVRITLFATLACWTGEFSVQKTTVVLIGCFSYKLIIIIYGVLTACVSLVSFIARSPNSEHSK